MLYSFQAVLFWTTGCLLALPLTHRKIAAPGLLCWAQGSPCMIKTSNSTVIQKLPKRKKIVLQSLHEHLSVCCYNFIFSLFYQSCHTTHLRWRLKTWSAFISSLSQEQPKITMWWHSNFEYRRSEMKKHFKQKHHLPKNKTKVYKVHCCDTDVNYLAAFLIMVTKAVF